MGAVRLKGQDRTPNFQPFFDGGIDVVDGMHRIAVAAAQPLCRDAGEAMLQEKLVRIRMAEVGFMRRGLCCRGHRYWYVRVSGTSRKSHKQEVAQAGSLARALRWVHAASVKATPSSMNSQLTGTSGRRFRRFFVQRSMAKLALELTCPRKCLPRQIY
jgi:hypothetical protein